MKKIIVMMMCILFLTGCTSENVENESIESMNVENESIELVTFDLVADSRTKIIYIKNYTYAGHRIYIPYYSENGKLCKFVDNKIVEVNEDEE